MISRASSEQYRLDLNFTFRILRPGDEIGFCERGDASVDPASAAQAGQLGDQGRGDHFVVLAADFYLGSDVWGQLLVLDFFSSAEGCVCLWDV